MKSGVELVLESFKELTKRKVKRYANVWSSKISYLYSVRDKISHNYVPFISRCFLVNNLFHDQKAQSLMRYLLPQIMDKKGLSVEDYSIVSYVYSCIDEDVASETVIANNYSEDVIKSSSEHDLLTFLRTVSLIMSRKTLGKVKTGSNTASEIANSILGHLWSKIKSINTRYMAESVEYLEFSELLLETIFISDLLGRLERESLNHDIIDFGSIFSLIKVSHLLESDKKLEIVERINSSDYDTVLDVLRKIHYSKLCEIYYIHHIFNRLCNTPAKSRMCRNEAIGYLDSTLYRIDVNANSSVGDHKDLKRLQEHLRAIKNSNVLENPHRSRIRWNYPCFIA